MLTLEKRRQLFRLGAKLVQQAMRNEVGRTGNEGIEALGEGIASQAALVMSLRVSPDYAKQFFSSDFVNDVLIKAQEHGPVMSEDLP